MIIESTDGEIFGGYTEKSWIKNTNTASPESFLFNLNKKEKYYLKGKGYIHSEEAFGGQIGFGDKNWLEFYFSTNIIIHF